MLKTVLNTILDVLLPQYCLRCQKQGGPLCDDCFSLIEINEYLYCPFCKTNRRVFLKNNQRVRALCPQHRHHSLDGLFAASSYQDNLLKKIISQLKYPPYLKTFSLPLANLIIAHFQTSGNEKFLKTGENLAFIPLPLFKRKEKKRGFNQAALIAQHLADYFHLPLLNNCLVKIKNTPSQTKLSLVERQKNVAGCFKVKENCQSDLSGKTILLIDDVFTTGATMEEAAKTLKQADARRVFGIVPAREPFGFQ